MSKKIEGLVIGSIAIGAAVLGYAVVSGIRNFRAARSERIRNENATIKHVRDRVIREMSDMVGRERDLSVMEYEDLRSYFSDIVDLKYDIDFLINVKAFNDDEYAQVSRIIATLPDIICKVEEDLCGFELLFGIEKEIDEILDLADIDEVVDSLKRLTATTSNVNMIRLQKTLHMKCLKRSTDLKRTTVKVANA